MFSMCIYHPAAVKLFRTPFFTPFMSSLDWLTPGRRVKGASQSRGGDEVQPLPSSMVAWADAEQVGMSVIQNVILEAEGAAAAAPTAHCKIPTEKVKNVGVTLPKLSALISDAHRVKSSECWK